MDNKFFNSACLCLAIAFAPTPANAYEITYIEWSGSGLYLNLTITTKSRFPECRVLLDGKPIGSGVGSANAGVALVMINIPSGLRDKASEFKYHCTG